MDDEKFFAWLDGELDPDEARLVAEKIAASPELSARAEKHRRLAAGLRGAFTPVMDAPSKPPGFGSARIIDFEERRRTRPGTGQWAALAASLALGLVIGSQFGGPSAERAPVAIEGDRLVAAASLERALDTSLASSAVGATRIGLTFRDRSGDICRSFTGTSASGLACRADGKWELRGLFPAGEKASGDYRMAAGQDPRLAALIDETIAGEPFDAAREKQALEGGWR